MVYALIQLLKAIGFFVAAVLLLLFDLLITGVVEPPSWFLFMVKTEEFPLLLAIVSFGLLVPMSFEQLCPGDSIAQLQGHALNLFFGGLIVAYVLYVVGSGWTPLMTVPTESWGERGAQLSIMTFVLGIVLGGSFCWIRVLREKVPSLAMPSNRVFATEMLALARRTAR